MISQMKYVIATKKPNPDVTSVGAEEKQAISLQDKIVALMGIRLVV